MTANQNHFTSENLAPQQVQQTVLQPAETNIGVGNKYKAFGQFLASSLIEMNEIQALTLVEKFTMDLVKYLKTEERKKSFVNASHRSNSGDENSLTIY